MDHTAGFSQAYGEAFAAAYNLYWSSFAERMAPKLVELFAGERGARVSGGAPVTPAAAPASDVTTADDRANGGETAEPDRTEPLTVLDVCCGTGQLARELVTAGFRVIGIDLSPYMLEHAERNNGTAVRDGRAEFRLEDAASFTVGRPVDIAVSLFDALNHLPDEPALAGCFASVARALRPGGLFVFDLNTPVGLARWNSITVEETDEVTIINRGIFAPGSSRAYTSITGFLRRPDGTFDRFTEAAYETVFAHDRVVALLVEAGFVDVMAASPEDLSTPDADPGRLGRIVYECRRAAVG